MMEQKTYGICISVQSTCPDTEAPIDTDCWSLMTLQQSSLVCVLNEFDTTMCEKVTLWYGAVSGISVSFIL